MRFRKLFFSGEFGISCSDLVEEMFVFVVRFGKILFDWLMVNNIDRMRLLKGLVILFLFLRDFCISFDVLG